MMVKPCRVTYQGFGRAPFEGSPFKPLSLQGGLEGCLEGGRGEGLNGGWRHESEALEGALQILEG